MADYIFLLETRLSPLQQSVIRMLQRRSRAAGINLYLTGGPMRDLLAGKPVHYLNFTTEGSPLPLAKPLAAEGAERVDALAPEQTLRFSLRGQPVRVSAARTDTPAKTAPRVPASIMEDLRRRGLTLNSMGLSLNEGSRGLLLDPANGAADIEARLVRMNHPYVFLEQPVMLLRAVRLRERLGFTIEERTLARMEAAREGKYLEHATAAALGQELEAIAYEPDAAAVLTALDAEGWLAEAFGKQVRAAKMKLTALRQIAPALEAWTKIGVMADPGSLALPAILGALPPADQQRLSRDLASRHLANWKALAKSAGGFEKKLLARTVQTPMQIQALIRQCEPEDVVFACLAPTQTAAAKKLKEFLARAQQAQQRLPRPALRQAGIDPLSPEGTRLLEELYQRLLQGELKQDAELAEETKQRILILRPPPPETKPRSAPGRLGARGAGRPPMTTATPPPALETKAKAAPAPVAKPAPAPAPPAPAAAAKPPAAPAAARAVTPPAAPKAPARPISKPRPAKPVKAKAKTKAAAAPARGNRNRTGKPAGKKSGAGKKAAPKRGAKKARVRK